MFVYVALTIRTVVSHTSLFATVEAVARRAVPSGGTLAIDTKLDGHQYPQPRSRASAQELQHSYSGLMRTI